MRIRPFVLAVFVFVGFALAGPLGLQASAQTGGCNAANGGRFNLEPRANASVQAAMSVAFLPNRASASVDLIVATGNDTRGIVTNPSPTIFSADAFYVSRSNANCAADFEGGEPAISNIFDTFLPVGSPTVVADSARDQFFQVDLRFGQSTDDNGIGIIRTNATNLLDPDTCPNGTLIATVPCWNLGSVTNITTLNAFLSNPHIAVDSRTSGTGAGDVYTVVGQADPNNTLHTSVFLTACTNGLNCGTSIKISGADLEGNVPWVQVRPDGGITISYRNTSFPGVNPEDIKFVNCKPNGAPKAPTCTAPILITTEGQPTFATSIGNLPMIDVSYPRHVNRLESDGHTVTTFLVYDRCEAPIITQAGLGNPLCSKSDVVLTSSNDGGNTWSPIAKVGAAKGQQFFGAIATDTSTGTVNIAYYSTEKDFFQLRPQVLLAQIAPGSTSVGTPHVLTTASGDVQASSPMIFEFEPSGFGDRLGLSAGGTGTPGQSRAYVSFTWNSVAGTYSGVPFPDMNNHLTVFQY